MIDETIARYDIKQDRRHLENSEKLDRNEHAVSTLKDNMNTQFGQIKATISEAIGAKNLTGWAIPVFISAAVLVAAIIELITRH